MLGMTLLLTAAATALDQLCLARMRRDVGVLTPEYLDPTLCLALDGAACDEAGAARHRLGQIAGQMRAVGPAASTSAILNHVAPGRRQAALLALAGAGAWQATATQPAGTEIHCRPAADGQVYVLAGAPAAGAAHAPHAVRDYAERLWILPAGHPCADGRSMPAEAPALVSSGGPDSLSLDAALRDLVLGLARAGAGALAEQVVALRQGTPLPLVVPLVQPTPALAPAVAA